MSDPSEGGAREPFAPFDEHDARLLANVRPPGWVNPTPAGRYNLVVIGAGTAGLVCAAGAAGLGARVALVERHLLGGDCLNVGCVPSKALIRSARAQVDAERSGELGLRRQGGSGPVFAAVMERVRRLRADLSPTDSARRFRELGVDVFLGEARFSGQREVAVGGTVLRFKRAVIATGSRPSVPDVEGLAAAGFLTNETLFALTDLPPAIGIVGGGPIGCEMAQAFARLGASVSLIVKGDRILEKEEPAAAEVVRAALERDGVRVRLRSDLRRVAGGRGRRVLHLEEAGRREMLEVDQILVAVGRTPNVQGLGLESARVAFDERNGVQVDDTLRTTNRAIYAAGDVCSQFKFTHAADATARIVIRNALFFGRAKVSRLVIPWCTFTDPEVARVGLDRAQARERGIAVDAFRVELSDVDRAVLDGEQEGFLEVLVKQGGDRILGATLVARHAGETIGELTLALTRGLGLASLAATIHPYPVQAEAIRKAADAWYRGRLTPFLRKATGFVLRALR